MNTEERIEQSIMDKIEQGQVSQRPRFFFVVEKYGLAGVIALSIFVAIGMSALIAFSLRAAHAYEYLRFGVVGLPAFFETTPLLLIGMLMFVCLGAFFFFLQTDVSYKRPLSVVVLSVAGFVALSGGVIAYSRAAEKITATLEAPGLPSKVVRPLIPVSTPTHDRGVVGGVVEVGEGYVALETKRGNMIIDTELYDGPTPTVGAELAVVGGREGDVFKARRVRVVKRGSGHNAAVVVTTTDTVVIVTGTPGVMAAPRQERNKSDERREDVSNGRMDDKARPLFFPREMPESLQRCFAECLPETHSLRVCRFECGKGKGGQTKINEDEKRAKQKEKEDNEDSNDERSEINIRIGL